MRVVIIAAAVTAFVTGWLLSETDSAPPTPVAPAVMPTQSIDIKAIYRSESADCKREGVSRKTCERRARERVLGELRREGARVSLR